MNTSLTNFPTHVSTHEPAHPGVAGRGQACNMTPSKKCKPVQVLEGLQTGTLALTLSHACQEVQSTVVLLRCTSVGTTRSLVWLQGKANEKPTCLGRKDTLAQLLLERVARVMGKWLFTTSSGIPLWWAVHRNISCLSEDN